MANFAKHLTAGRVKTASTIGDQERDQPRIDREAPFVHRDVNTSPEHAQPAMSAPQPPFAARIGDTDHLGTLIELDAGEWRLGETVLIFGFGREVVVARIAGHMVARVDRSFGARGRRVWVRRSAR